MPSPKRPALFLNHFYRAARLSDFPETGLDNTLTALDCDRSDSPETEDL